MKRILHEIWKERDGWKVQCPCGRLTFHTRKTARVWVRVMESSKKLTSSQEAEIYNYR
jgi:hypothetical protein